MTTARAIGGSGPISARVRPPGSKSITNRALLIAALGDGTSSITGGLDSDDTSVMRRALARLGVVTDTSASRWTIVGTNGRLGHTDEVLDVGASGTTARFLVAALTLAEGKHTVDGVARMRERPIGELAEALSQMGAEVETVNGFPPVHVWGTGLRGGEVVIDASRSSQFVSAAMMVAPYADRSVTIRFRDGVVVSRPYLDTTVETMRAFGASVELSDDQVQIDAGHRYRGVAFAVEPDASAAAYPLVAAAITGGMVEIAGLSGHSTQADMGLLRALEAMGCEVERQRTSVRLQGPSRLGGITVDMNAMPDASLALAVAALFADGPTTITNVATLRLKETDRLDALGAELHKLGAEVEAGDDWLTITPVPHLQGALISTYDDHRMAMAFSLAGLRIPGVRIENPGCVSKTWPDYFDMLEELRESAS